MKIIFTLCLASILTLSMAQPVDHKYSICAGYGHYEGFLLGAGKYLKKEYRLIMSAGYHSNSDHKQFSASASLSKKLLTLKTDMLTAGFLSKFIYWNYEDEYFLFSSIAFEPAIELLLALTPEYLIFVDSGPVFNMQLSSERKNYETIGWPNKTGFNITLGITKKFKL